MSLAEPLLPLLPGGAGVVAFVGAGGKSSALFSLGLELGARGRSVLATTTTRMAPPLSEPGGPGPGARVVLVPEMEAAGPGGPDGGPWPAPRPGLTLLFSRETGECDAEGIGNATVKMKGIHPSWIPALRRAWDLVLVEADGSFRRPVKAPASHEPVLPPGTDLVVGVVGLDALGKPMDERTVHRPELFARVTGCPAGAPIEWRHLVALARHPEGLFKGAGRPRVVLLNKVDKAPFVPSAEQLAELGAERALVVGLGVPAGERPE